MNRPRLSKTLRAQVAEQAHYRCGYCLTPEWIVGAPMEIDHLLPIALGGLSTENNLWLACSFCNDYKGEQTAGRDSFSGEWVRLFNPRTDIWAEHFKWEVQGSLIVGQTPIGRVTIIALQLNRPVLAHARKLWAKVGWHPPKD